MHKAVIVTIRILTDVMAFAAVFIAMGVLQNITPHQLGYFPSDVSLKHPYKSSTIPSWLLYVVTISLIVCTTIAVELAISWNNLREKKSGIPVVLYSLYDHLLVAFFGYCITIAIVDVGKAAVGRPRPNFFESCNPTAEKTTPLNYVTQFKCNPTNQRDASESIKSFPSGHSATAMFTAIYLCIYVQLRQPVWRIPALRAGYQVVLLCLAAATCTSRVVDNKHHPSDVIAGGFLGLFVAFSVPFYMCRLFPRDPENAVRQVTSQISLIRNRGSSELDDNVPGQVLSMGKSSAATFIP